MTSNDQSSNPDSIPSSLSNEDAFAPELDAVADPLAGAPADDSVTAPVVGQGAIGDTAGTGTIIALGCITGTIFLIIVGLIYLLITQVFG